MEKKQFKAESQRLMDLMINSIYTHKEIFLRELISNASDAVDKLAYRALTDDKVGINRDEFKIVISADPNARTITVTDNGIGMTREDMENNLGTIAKSGSLQFKKDMEKADDSEIDIIGQFGVGFYSAFMVADHVSVISKAYGSDEAWEWASEGVDGYTLEPSEKTDVGTTIVMSLKADAEDEDYSTYADPITLSGLVRKYSDYIRYPVRMEMEHSKPKPKPEDAPEDYKTEYETVKEWETINSMIPLWQRAKSDVTEEEYNSFYKEKFGDWEDPILTAHIAAEGVLEYKSIFYIPSHAPMDYYSSDYQKGLQLYSSGVLIMENCADLLPDYFSFVRGIVDSPDVSLNISREVLQHDRQLKIIASNLEKKIKSELLKLQKDNREKYETFWDAFGMQLKYGVLGAYGANKDKIKELLLFRSSKEDKFTTLSEYKDRMPESQTFIYYVCAESTEKAKNMPQAERILDAGFEVLYLVNDEDEMMIQMLDEGGDPKFKSVNAEDALPITDEDKAKAEQAETEHKDVLDFVKETLGDKIKLARISKILKTGSVCLNTDGPVSIEMEKYFKKMRSGFPMQAERVLELNPDSEAFAALCRAVEADKETAANYVELLYNQALLISDLPLPDPARYTELVCSLMK
ncbi:MAG: molecular chaperone HtpG [Evtepia sp.]